MLTNDTCYFKLTARDKFIFYVCVLNSLNKCGKSITKDFESVLLEDRIQGKLWVDRGREFYDKINIHRYLRNLKQNYNQYIVI